MAPTHLSVPPIKSTAWDCSIPLICCIPQGLLYAPYIHVSPTTKISIPPCLLRVGCCVHIPWKTCSLWSLPPCRLSPDLQPRLQVNNLTPCPCSLAPRAHPGLRLQRPVIVHVTLSAKQRTALTCHWLSIYRAMLICCYPFSQGKWRAVSK